MSLYQSSRDKHPELLNIGKPWTTEQENLLIKKVGEGKNHEELSIEFGRTTGGIRSRLREIAVEMIDLGKSVEYAMEKTKLTRDEIYKKPLTANIKENDSPYKLYFDGKAEPNPGRGSAAAVLYFEDKIIFEVGKYLEYTTNNQAEYLGLIIGLKECIKKDVKELQVFGDSNLVIEQSAGRWKVKNEGLIELNNQVKTLIKHFTNISFTHIYRNLNTKADELTNIVFDSKKNINYEEEVVTKQKTINEIFKVVESKEKYEMKEVIDLMKEIRDLLKKFVENVVVE